VCCVEPGSAPTSVKRQLVFDNSLNDTVVLLQSSVGEIQQQMAKAVAKLDELIAGVTLHTGFT